MSCETAVNAGGMCNPQLRDVWTRVLPFVGNPSPLTHTCHFFQTCWEHALYLEGLLPCPYVSVTQVPRNATVGVPHCSDGLDDVTRNPPVLLHRADLLVRRNFHYICRLSLVNLCGLTRIDASFHPGDVVETLHVSGLPDLFSLGDDVLGTGGVGLSVNSCALREVTFEHLPRLAVVGDRWMDHCARLESFVLRDAPKLDNIGTSFLFHCTRLKTVSFEALPMLRNVYIGWLDECRSLEGIRLTDMPSLKCTGKMFLKGCHSVNEAIFDGLPQWEGPNDHFLDAATALTTVTLAGFKRLKWIGDCCISDCPHLTQVTLEDLPALEFVFARFLTQCGVLESFELHSLPALRMIDDCCLADCASLKSVTFRDLPVLTSIGEDWLADCPCLQRLMLSGLPQLTDVGDGFRSVTTEDRDDVTLTSSSEVVVLGPDCHDSLPSVLKL